MEENKEEGTFTIKKTTIWKFATFIFAGLFVISLFTGGFSGLFSKVGTPTGGTVVNIDDTPTGNIKLNIEKNDPVLGSKDAKISIVEFSDFQCPFCARAFTGALADFKNSDYFKKGEVNLIYKHFPLNSIHPYAQKAAEASECANRQGKFWEYHDLLFINQQSLDVTNLKSYADQLKLDTTKFNKCLDSGEATAEVNKETSEATAAGGRGTPYFVLINKDGETTTVSGAVPFANFEAAIKSLQ